jgi:putative endonuclease
MEYLVYVLYSSKLDKYYVGMTGDLEDRMIRHNTGREKYTSKGMPWRLVNTYSCVDRTEAMKLERKIKKRGIKRYLEDN